MSVSLEANRRRGAQVLLVLPTSPVPTQPLVSCAGLPPVRRINPISGPRGRRRLFASLTRHVPASRSSQRVWTNAVLDDLEELGGRVRSLGKAAADPHAVLNECSGVVSSACGPRHTRRNYEQSSAGHEEDRTDPFAKHAIEHALWSVARSVLTG